MSPLNAIQWIDFPSNADTRGVLTSIESGQDIPFEIKRLFYMHHIVADRGGHAHRETDQVLIPVAGKFTVSLSDGVDTQTFAMDSPTRGLYTPRMLFVRLYDFCAHAVCLVLANSHYDRSKSIRSWEEYLKVVAP